MKILKDNNYRNTALIYSIIIVLIVAGTFIASYLNPEKLLSFGEVLHIILLGPVYLFLNTDLVTIPFERPNIFNVTYLFIAFITLPGQFYLTNRALKLSLAKYKLLLIVNTVGWIAVGLVSMSVIWMFRIS